jgi:HSP20 family protein
MTMPVWDAFAEMDALRREMERRFADAGPGFGRAPRVAFLPGRGARQYPLVNVSEDEQNVYIEALAPGVDPKSLDLSVMEGALTIKGEKPGLAQVSAEAYHRNERAAGRFVRTVELPLAVDAGRVSADYRNGLLLVTMPKAESARPRQVPITVR